MHMCTKLLEDVWPINHTSVRVATLVCLLPVFWVTHESSGLKGLIEIFCNQENGIRHMEGN